jgi:hypothetical protein
MAVPPPIPINRYLTPDIALGVPSGFVASDLTLVNGLPQLIELDNDTKLLLVVPTGMIATWRDADPTTVISQSEPELAPFVDQPSAPLTDAARLPVRLLLQINSAITAAIPLAAGLERLSLDAGDSGRGVRIELMVRSWRICAGSLRGPGDFGSTISIVWRRADKAADQYSTPPPNPIILPRLQPILQFESTLGLAVYEPFLLDRFSYKKVILR